MKAAKQAIFNSLGSLLTFAATTLNGRLVCLFDIGRSTVNHYFPPELWVGHARFMHASGHKMRMEGKSAMGRELTAR